MELGRFEMTYTVLLPCAFTIYLNPEDHATLSGVFELVIEDARRALRARVAELNGNPKLLGVRRRGKTSKEYKIACRDWILEFLPDTEVPAGDVEIHSQLNETVEPGYRGTKTTLMEREPSATAQRTTNQRQELRRAADPVFAEIRYEDDSGPQIYLVTQNRVRIGRGGDDQPMDLALYTNDEVSREHLVIQRDAATGIFFIADLSTNGTWVDGKRLRKGADELLPSRAEIGVGEVLTLSFEVRK
jgi:pSer/pThr/pTyr-binding forkhead associated (FHA) protein